MPGEAPRSDAVQGRLMEVYGHAVEQRALQKGLLQGPLEGREEGVLRTIEGFLGRNVPWSTIEAAMGIDEAEFRRLRQQPDSAAGGAAKQ